MDALSRLQRNILDRAESDAAEGMATRLFFAQSGEDYHVDFYGDPFGDDYAELIEVLSDEELAEQLASLILRGPDEGANGTRNWDLELLARSSAVFPRLRRLSIEQTAPTDHNRTIVSDDGGYDEAGMHALLLEKMPLLESLSTPSAPSPAFFEVGPRPLQSLSVDAGYDHQGFIRQLARSTSFPELRSLEFGEYYETYMENFAELVTPFEDYRTLFASDAFATVRFFRWTNPTCSSEQIAELKAMDRSRSIQIVRWSAEWV